MDHNLNKTKIYKLAVKNGHYDVCKPVTDTIEIVYDEIKEVLNAEENGWSIANGSPFLKTRETEIADVAMVIYSLCGLYDIDLTVGDEYNTRQSIASQELALQTTISGFCMYCRDMTARLTSYNARFDLWTPNKKLFILPILAIKAYCEANDLNLQKLIDQKHAHNLTRPYKHGKN